MSFVVKRKLVAAESGILMTLKPNCYAALTLNPTSSPQVPVNSSAK
jgi:hypothetical protein